MIDLSPIKESLQEKPIAILGLGVTGLAVFEACKAAGIEALLWDDDAKKRDAAKAQGATVRDLTRADFSKISLLCASPGIPLTGPKASKIAVRAQEAGVEILCDLELLYRALPSRRIIAVTGTNGKSTTTALITHILRGAGRRVAMGGNIGAAALLLDDPGEEGLFVLEMSSFQLDLCSLFSPAVSVWLNISADHLDRHGSMDAYVAAKTHIFRGKGEAIVSIDDSFSKDMQLLLKRGHERSVVSISCEKPLMKGVFASHDGILFDGPFKILDMHLCPALPGQHNWQNAAAAYAACRAVGVSVEDIVNGLRTFPGLAHRQNTVLILHGISYINDSKATNDQAASMALRTYAPIYWIAGGRSKGGGYPYCQQHLARVRHAFLIGEAEDELAVFLAGQNIKHTRCGTLEVAVQKAHQLAEAERLPHAVVLMSPACASLDQFRSYEERGAHFVQLVQKLGTGDTPAKVGRIR